MPGTRTNQLETEPKKPQSPPVYEAFILCVSALSMLALLFAFLPFIPDRLQQLLLSVNMWLSLVFLWDFVLSLWHQPDRWAYFRRWGWIELLGCVPYPPLLHLARIARLVRAVRTLRSRGVRSLSRDADQNRPYASLLATLFLAIVVVVGASLVVLVSDQDYPESNIVDAGDALWWAIVTVTTVGYGSEYPVSSVGRIAAAVVMVVGISLWGVLASSLAAIFVRGRRSGTAEELAAIRYQLDLMQESLVGLEGQIQDLRKERGD